MIPYKVKIIARIEFITAVYFLVVYIVGSLFGNVAEIHSFPTILVVMALITLMFRPLERRIHRLIDNLFHKKRLEDIEKENLLLLSRLQDQERMRSVATLAAGMAHEIKNPLTSIKTFAEYLPKKYDDPDFREKFSRIVMDEVDRVNNIVRQLLDFAKPADLESKPVLIAELLEETLGLLNSNMVKKNISLFRQFDSYAIVLGDSNQLKQCFLNIFLNAIQSIQDKGELSVTARTESDGFVKISVKDSGCGMSDEQLKHAFDPFYTTKEEGTGLGLAIVHSIITKHAGKIEISSRPSQGTTVTVFLKSQS